MKFAFEASLAEVQANLDTFAKAVFSCLESEFLVMPRGSGFIDYPVFEQGYEVLKKATSGFSSISSGPVSQVAFRAPVSIVVLRTMLGFTPPEWAYVTTQRTGLEVNQGFARSLERRIRISPLRPLKDKGMTANRIKALVEAACQLLKEGAPIVHKS
jgi:hypothetical protein